MGKLAGNLFQQSIPGQPVQRNLITSSGSAIHKGEGRAINCQLISSYNVPADCAQIKVNTRAYTGYFFLRIDHVKDRAVHTTAGTSGTI